MTSLPDANKQGSVPTKPILDRIVRRQGSTVEAEYETLRRTPLNLTILPFAYQPKNAKGSTTRYELKATVLQYARLDTFLEFPPLQEATDYQDGQTNRRLRSTGEDYHRNILISYSNSGLLGQRFNACHVSRQCHV